MCVLGLSLKHESFFLFWNFMRYALHLFCSVGERIGTSFWKMSSVLLEVGFDSYVFWSLWLFWFDFTCVLLPMYVSLAPVPCLLQTVFVTVVFKLSWVFCLFASNDRLAWIFELWILPEPCLLCLPEFCLLCLDHCCLSIKEFVLRTQVRGFNPCCVFQTK